MITSAILPPYAEPPPPYLPIELVDRVTPAMAFMAVFVFVFGLNPVPEAGFVYIVAVFVPLKTPSTNCQAEVFRLLVADVTVSVVPLKLNRLKLVDVPSAIPNELVWLPLPKSKSLAPLLLLLGLVTINAVTPL